jgi:hypothetical protein
MAQQPTTTQNGAIIKMYHKVDPGGGDRETAIFSHLYPITKPVENFIKSSVMASPNYYVSQQGYWLYADFPMAYDPCVCSFTSKIIFEIETTQQMSIVLNGSIVGYFSQVVASTPGNVSDKDNIFDIAGNIIKSGNKSYDSWSKSITEIEKFAKKQHIDLQNQILFGTTNMKNLLTAIPYLGVAFGVMDYFQSLSKGSNKSSPMQFGANLKFSGNGSITQTNPYGTYTYFSPGSNQSSATEKTIYDNPLGVVSFLKPIKLEYVDYYNSANGGGLSFAPIRQYKISEPVKFALNPSSGLEIVDIQASVVMRYKPISTHIFDFFLNNSAQYGNFFTRPVGFINTPKFVDKVKSVGLETEMFTYNTNKDSVLVSIRTPYVPLTCFDNTSIFLHRNSIDPNKPSQLDSYLDFIVKFIIKARVINQPEKEVIFLQSYTVSEISSELNNGENSHNWAEGDIYNQLPTFQSALGQQPALPSPFVLAKIDDQIQNASISDGTSVMRDLTLGPNLTITSVNPIVFSAGNEILVESDTYIGSESTLTIGLPNINCINDINAMRYTEPEIATFCSQGGLYANHSMSKTLDDAMSKDKLRQPLNVKFINVNVVNPFSNNLIINYELLANGPVEISLQNLSGKTLFTSKLENSLVGSHIENIDLTGYNILDGMYILEFKSAESNVHRVKLIRVPN